MASVKGGDKLGPALQRLAEKLSNASTVQVGFMADATYDDGKPVAMIAAIQEYGAPAKGIPPRPFMRTMVAEKSGGWPAGLTQALIDNDFDAAKALAVMGNVMEAELRQSIIDMDSPALSAVTIMLRGMRSEPRYRDMAFGDMIREAISRVAAGKTSYGASTQPLVDTGHMLNSVTSVVE